MTEDFIEWLNRLDADTRMSLMNEDRYSIMAAWLRGKLFTYQQVKDYIKQHSVIGGVHGGAPILDEAAGVVFGNLLTCSLPEGMQLILSRPEKGMEPKHIVYTELDDEGNPTGNTVVKEEPANSPAHEADGTFVTEEEE